VLARVDIWRDRSGKPLFILWSTRLVTDVRGRPAAVLTTDDNVHSNDGRHLATYERGLVRDHSGLILLYGERVRDAECPKLPESVPLGAYSPPVTTPKPPNLEKAPPRAKPMPVWSEQNPTAVIRTWRFSDAPGAFRQFDSLDDLESFSTESEEEE
jgi:hypothetical protein